ncbi:PorP/SprF family type IX secretion system membrane protein [Chitinophagales bacterium]|nr:PorP/SprF family type IX secretion system membrane protein [Chitinophagales bacterium]
MRKLLLFALFICLGITEIQAQDFHFSQFYAAPNLYSPALTGNHGSAYRVGVINRSQFAASANQFQTIGMYADASVLQDNLVDDSWVGTGLKFYYDDAGAGTFQSFVLGGSLAFHKAVAERVYLSFGTGFTYSHRSIDPTALIFNDQIGAEGFDPGLLTDETFVTRNVGRIDIDAGIALSYSIDEYNQFTFGAGFLHLNRPPESFYFQTNTSGTNLRGMRSVFHASGIIGQRSLFVEPAILYSTERGASEMILGANAAFEINGEGRIYGGMWYRLNESIIPVVGAEMFRFRVFVSYDLNMQSLQSAASSRSAFEVSLVHSGNWKERGGNGTPCPRF